MKRSTQKFFSLTQTALLAFSCLSAPQLFFPEAAQARAPAARRAGPDQIARTGGPVARKLSDWLAFTNANASAGFGRLRAFLRENPDWPAREEMALAAEKSMPGNLPDSEVVSWFRVFPPQTAAGMSRLINALPEEEAAAVLNRWWPEAALDNREQAQILSRHTGLIVKEAHRARFNMIMAKRQYTNVRALAARLGGAYPQLAEARIMLAERKPGADAAVARVPASLQKDAGLLYERMRWRLRNDDTAGAIDILKQMPADAAADWWGLRHSIVRDLIKDRQYARAYDIAAAHGLASGSGVGFAEGEFLSGWLALRFLNRPQAALHHFVSLHEGTATPISRSRGAYWAGRAGEALGEAESMQRWYRVAAFHQTTFYGGLADEKLPAGQRLFAREAVSVTAAEREAFAKREMVQAAQLLAAAGMGSATRIFLSALSDSAKTGQDYLLAAELAENLGHRPGAVRIAKAALNEGFFIPDHLYPTLEGAEGRSQPLVHAVIRQESVFDPRAVSPVGARGLMQLMPPTAKEEARRIGLPYSLDRLLTDPLYNRRLGRAYLEKLLSHYDYESCADKRAATALAVAAYNGGGRNVAKWMAANGDPRDSRVDLIDWIELIPFPETRNYVQRVLEGERVYKTSPALQVASNDSRQASKPKSPKR